MKSECSFTLFSVETDEERERTLEEYDNERKKIKKIFQTESNSPTIDTEMERVLEEILDNPRDFYQKLYYQLNVKQREQLKKNYQGKSCNNCTNTECRASIEDKSKDNTACFGWQNPLILGKERLLKK